ncbi:MAG: SGNH/GDSL hydrolase family protein [Clostridiales bacterium]|nr:SGNH/GDSL hydrolase family protein [Clostridiales bacterium]
MESKIKVLFQGDSITDGMRLKDEASRWDKNHQIGHSWAYIVSAKLGLEHPCRFEFVNRAVSSNTVVDLSERWEKDAVGITPDILAILIGINDASRICKDASYTAKEYITGYEKLLQRSLEANPETKFILLEPFTTRDNNLRQASDTLAILLKELCVKYGAMFVPLQDYFDEVCDKYGKSYWLWDDVHPTEAGHGLIANEFLKRFEAGISLK